MIPLCPVCLSSHLRPYTNVDSPIVGNHSYLRCRRCKAIFSTESAIPTPTDGMRCRVCGCTDANACPGGCHWVAVDLCSRCADKAEKKAPRVGSAATPRV